jgi:hypothetical protein
VKIKVSRFRVEQRNMYEELGWTLPEGGAASKPGKKRAVKEGEDGEAETPTRKQRTPRKKKEKAGVAEAEVKKSDDEEMEGKDEHVEDDARSCG